MHLMDIQSQDPASTAIDEYYAEIEHLLLDMLDAVRAEVTAPDPAGALRQFVCAHVRWRLERLEAAEAFDVVLGDRARVNSLPAEHRRRIRSLKRLYLEELRGILREGARKGAFSFGDLRITAFAIASLCASAHAWYDPEGPLTPAQVGEMYAGFVAGMVHADR
ncbi:MAG TPA: hypothetical protein VN213_04450 [Solirubrobacteraceae bacterium]|nr:hypothetical protein [Solirubrobacteraceae bacterium]